MAQFLKPWKYQAILESSRNKQTSGEHLRKFYCGNKDDYFQSEWIYIYNKNTQKLIFSS